MRTRMLAVLLCLCLLTGSVAGVLCLAETAGTVTGTVVGITSGKLYVRSSPDTSPGTGNVIDKLVNGDKVTWHETLTANGKTWHKVTTANNKTGYCSAEYIALDKPYVTDEDFEAYLTAQKFPESYKPLLRQMHIYYPNWVFKADKLSMTFDAAVAAESKIGLNTVKNADMPDAWKSMEAGAYDWSTNSYVAYDSGGWVATTAATVAYYLDPRNWLTANYAFQYEELSFSAEQTVDGTKAILPAKLADIAPALYNAAKTHNVSAYFLAAKIVQEGTVSNKLALGEVPGYEGYYNFFDIGAYAHDGNGAVTNGAIYAKNHGWDTPEKCLDDSIRNNFANSYIGLGQNTTFYQKFNLKNTTSGLYRHQYMSNVGGAAGEGSVMYRNLSEDARACVHTFLIPVYTAIPDTPAPKPPTTGNNNNFLDTITVSGCSLTPTFDRYTLRYAVQVDKSVSSVTVAAQKNAAAATLTGTGTVALRSGENTVTLTVTATSGAVRTYVITITREPGGEDPPTPPATDPTVTGTVYTLDETAKTVTKVEPGTAPAAFIQALAVKNGSAKLFDANGKEKTTGAIGTGDILRLYRDTTPVSSYTVLIYGDVNGDGAITSFDLRVAQKHILQVQKLSGALLTAADINHDGAITSFDLRIAQKYILKLTTTLQ